LKNFLEDPIENVKLSVGHNIRQWVVSMTGAKGPIYAGEKFRLKFSFPVDYPFSPPSVYFLQPIPKHEHVYTNGDICLNLLGA
jgi:ubiquitin-conjugating enzyme E2 W